MHDDVESWDINRVLQWLDDNNFSRFKDLFLQHDINGPVLAELNYTYLKDMGITLVGDRARILQAVKKQLRPNAITSIDSNPLPQTDHKTNLMNLSNAFHNSQKPNDPLLYSEYDPDSLSANSNSSAKSSENYHGKISANSVDSSSKPDLDVKDRYLFRKNLDMASLDFQPSSPVTKAKLRAAQQIVISPRSSSIKNQDLSSAEISPNIQNHELSPPSPGRDVYKQLFGDDQPTRSEKSKFRIRANSQKKPKIIKVQNLNGAIVNINITGLNDGKSIRKWILISLDITEEFEQAECIIFYKELTEVGNFYSQPDDQELFKICDTIDINEPPLQFVTRKKMTSTIGRRKESIKDEDFIRTANPERSAHKIQNFFGEAVTPVSPLRSANTDPSLELSPISAKFDEAKQSKLSRFFGERPPDDMIVDQLESFFPGISQELSKAPTGRSSTIRDMVQSAIINKRMSRAFVRQSNVTSLVNRESRQISDSAKSSPESIVSFNGTSPSVANERRLDHGLTLNSLTIDSSEIFSSSSTLDKKPVEVKQIRWQKGGLIGQGGFGKVYHALNLDSGEFMAVKQVLLGPETKIRKKKEDALQREIDLLSELDHEHIVRYFGSESTETSFNVFLEYVSGGSISSILHKHGKFEEELARGMTCQILFGLEYLHSRSIIHRDIKGANILVDYEGVAKISDFGISKKNEYQMAYQRVTRMSMQGSINWMAAEVARGKGYSAKVDIWSLGCLVMEMLTGNPPWYKVQGNIIYLLGTGNAPPIPENLSNGSKEFVSQCFLIDPEQRPTATQLLHRDWCILDPYSFDFVSWIKNSKVSERQEENIVSGLTIESDSLTQTITAYDDGDELF